MLLRQVPWLYWAMGTPAPVDTFNVWPGDGGPWAALAGQAAAARDAVSAQSWPEIK